MSTLSCQRKTCKTFPVFNGLMGRWTANLHSNSDECGMSPATRRFLSWFMSQLSSYRMWVAKKCYYLDFIMRLGCWISDDVGWQWHHLGPMKLVLLQHLLGVDLMGLPVPSITNPRCHQWRPKSSQKSIRWDLFEILYLYRSQPFYLTLNFRATKSTFLKYQNETDIKIIRANIKVYPILARTFKTLPINKVV